MAEEILPDQQKNEYIQENSHGALDFDSLYFVEEVEHKLPSEKNDHAVKKITFKNADQHMGLAAALIAEYLAMNPPLDDTNSITISQRTARILETIGIPFQDFTLEQSNQSFELIPFPRTPVENSSAAE